MIDLLLSKPKVHRWLIYCASNFIVAIYLFLTASEANPGSLIRSLLALVFAVGAILLVSQFFTKAAMGSTPATKEETAPAKAPESIRESAGQGQVSVSKPPARMTSRKPA